MCSVRKGVLRNFVKFTENTCARVSFLNKVAGCVPVSFNKIAGLKITKVNKITVGYSMYFS